MISREKTLSNNFVKLSANFLIDGRVEYGLTSLKALMSMEWRTLYEFTLKYIENLQCLIHLNDFVDQSSLRPFSHLFETATRKFTRGTVGPSHLQILRQFLTQNSA